MAQPNSIMPMLEYLIEEASREYSANDFTILTNPHLDGVAIRFRVPQGTAAKRPTPPPEEIRPARWHHAAAEVMSDNFGELHMTWEWPADPYQIPADLKSVAKLLSQRTGATIETR